MISFGVPALDTLIDLLAKLPGIGRKTAQRLAIYILKSDTAYTEKLSRAILALGENTHECPECFNIAEDDVCNICRNPGRDRSKICVVEDMVDIIAIEASAEFHGVYHVLGGVISPLNRVGPEDLHITEFVDRVKKGDVHEILLAINPSTEGEATMIYLSRLLKGLPVKVTRIASGVPIGSSLEFLDETTIGRAIISRQEL